MTKPLPKNLTSYDFLKMAAVLLMLVDHVGDYFFHEELWFRVVGRFCVPIWFFLIGYARSRDMSFKLWGWMAVLAVADVVSGLGLFPVNILLTMIIIRACIDQIMMRTDTDQSVFWAIMMIMFVLAIPSAFFFEYGTLGFIMAIFGYWIRAQQDGRQRYGGEIKSSLVQSYFAYALFSFALLQFLTFGFSQVQFFVLAGGTTVIMFILSGFKPAEYPKLTEILPAPLIWLVQLFGRRTMEVYVIHLIILNCIALYLGTSEDFELFRFSLFPPGIAEDLGFTD